MKRKVNLVGQNTLTVSLPTKWAKENNLKKGDEIELMEENNEIVLSSNLRDKKEKSIEIDISGLDRTSIMLLMRGAYRTGYDEIILKFDQQYTLHHRTQKKIGVLQVIHAEANRLIGVSIIKETENACIIKDFSANLEQEFEPSVRRVFLVLLGMGEDLIKGVKQNDTFLVSSLEEKHDTATKFISYCLRIINKGVVQQDNIRKNISYHTLASLDTVVDIYKYAARDFIPSFKKKLSKEAQKLLSNINDAVRIYYELYYAFENNKCDKFMKSRDEFKRELFSKANGLTQEELILLTYMEHVYEIIWDLILARTSINQNKI